MAGCVRAAARKVMGYRDLETRDAAQIRILTVVEHRDGETGAIFNSTKDA